MVYQMCVNADRWMLVVGLTPRWIFLHILISCTICFPVILATVSIRILSIPYFFNTIGSLDMGLSENRVYSQLWPFNRDNDQQNHWVKRGTQHFQTHPYV